MTEQLAVSLKSISSNRAQEVAFGRFLSNARVDEEGLILGITNRVSTLVSDRHVLSIQDTSEFHYHQHIGRIKDGSGLGEAGRSPLGYFIHPSLVVNAADGMILGLSDVHLFNRPWQRQVDTSSRKQRPIEQKESYKWISSSQRSKKTLSTAASVTIIQDRDGDIFESFARVPDQKTHLLIRSKTDRKIEGPLQSLYDKVDGQCSAITYELEINGENKKRQKRKAKMQIRFCRAKIKRPASLKSPYPPSIELSIVEAKEVQASVPETENPIIWRLLTTHQVKDFIDAVHIVYWYSLRWLIEELFRLLKKKGFDLESSELETGAGLRKLGILCMQAATKVMQLRQARQEDCQLRVKEVFDEQEQECLQELLRTLEGNTEKLKNPHPDYLLRWACWIIARLGGWKGYKSQRPPGVVTLKRGLQRFEILYLGWKLAKANSASPDTS